MSTKEVKHDSQITVGSDVDGALLDRVNKVQKEIDERTNSNVNVIGKSPEEGRGHVDNTGSAADSNAPSNSGSDVGATSADAGPDNSTTADPTEENQGGIPVDQFLEDNKTSKQDLLNQLLDDPDTSLTIKNKRGKETKTSYNNLKADIERGRISQAKLDKISNSEEMEFGLVMAAAKSGDKEAQKKALIMLKEFSGKEEIDDFIDDVDEVKGDFDTKAVKEKQKAEEDWEEYFPESVKNSVDYNENLDKMEKVLKPQIPEKVYEFYTNRPETKRIMYELVAQGIAQEAMDAFFEKYDSLPSVEQIKIDNDPAAWGTAFNSSFESLKRSKAKSASENAESEDNSSEPMASVSAGAGSRTRAPAPKKSFLKMSKAEFAEEKARLLAGG